jgi:hypothetical protein
MFWHDAGRLAFQIGTPLAAIRVLTWLVALFGSERLSKRAMSLLHRKAPDHEHPVQDAAQCCTPPVLILTPSARKTLVTKVSSREFDDFGPTWPVTKDNPKVFRSGGPREDRTQAPARGLGDRGRLTSRVN